MQDIRYKGQGEKLKDEKVYGEKKGSTFILSSDDCGDWLVCGSGDGVSVRTDQSFQTGETYIQGDIYLGKRSMMTIMDRSVLYQINGLEKPQKISGFLKEKGYSRQNLVDLRKDEQAICLNGTYVHMNHMLAEGDVLTVWIREKENSGQIRPVKLPFAIVYEDEDLLVINKPEGMPVHPSRGNPDNSLGNALAWYFKEQGVPFVFRCINRLDRDTSGLTIVAKHAVSAAILGQMVRAKAEQGLKAPGIHRTYLAIVEGKVMPVSGVIDAPIARQEDRCLRRVVDLKRGDRAVTHYRVLTGWQTGNAQKFRSLVKLQLETGRTHQIRVHMAYLGHPLVGDFLYNPAYGENQIDRRDDENSGERHFSCGKTFSCERGQYDIGRQALHAWKLSFFHPMTGEPMEFTAPLPPDMQRLIPEEALPSV